MHHEAQGQDEMHALARDVLARLSPSTGATVLTLSGELGAGKTTFVQGIASALGVQESVVSPTFVLEKIYKLDGRPPARGFEYLIHMDAYRLKSAHELRVLGWEEIVREPGNLVLLEWPERVEAAIPKSALRIRIDILGDGRRITIDGENSDEKGKA